MAFIHMNYFSRTLLRNVDVNVIIPTETCQEIHNDFDSNFKEEYPVLYLFHGAFGDYTDWSRFTDIESCALQYQIAVVMPSVENTFAMNIEKGDQYLTFAGKELPGFVSHLFPVSTKRERVFAGGLSMGGYVACSVAAHYPETFSKAVTLSGALDIGEVRRMRDKGDERLPFNLELLMGSRFEQPEAYDLPELFRKDKENGWPIAVYQACGTEDFLYEINQQKKSLFQEICEKYRYEEGPGAHEWPFWNQYIKNAVQWLLQDETVEKESESVA